MNNRTDKQTSQEQHRLTHKQIKVDNATCKQYVTAAMIDFLPIARPDMIQTDFSNQIRMLGTNSKVVRGVLDNLKRYAAGLMDNPYTFDIDLFIQDILQEFQTTQWIKKYHGPIDSILQINDNDFLTVNKRVKWIVSIGMPAIKSCPGAGDCMILCYAYQNENGRKGSYDMHEHNYHVSFGKKHAEIVELITAGLTEQTRVVRLFDSGDCHTYNFMHALYTVATNNPDITFYGYTKTSFYLYKLLKNVGSLPVNFRLNVSETDNPISTQYKLKLQAEYPEYTTECQIWQTLDRMNPDIPFNNEEQQATLSWVHGVHKFAIGVHLTGCQKAYVADEVWQTSLEFGRMEKDGRLSVKTC